MNAARRMKLSEVPVGAVVTVCSVSPGPEGQGRRLEDMGVIAGTVIRVERRAPMGDPTIYEVRHARLAVRRADASLVDVQAILEAVAAVETVTADDDVTTGPRTTTAAADGAAGGDDVAL